MIRLEHVSKRFEAGGQTVEAVKDVSLHIEKGSIAGIIGFSGAGKSTLARCVNLLERPTEGRVIVGGSELTALSGRQLREKRKKIGMIFQHFNLFASRTVYGNVAYPLRGSGRSKKEIEDKVKPLLELVGLSDKADAYPSQLSGGQKQRVAIARALASDPEVLLSDEATSALDPETTQSILRLLKEVNRALGVTILIITHEMQVIKEICSQVYVMEGGRIVEQGDVFQVFAVPRQAVTRRFVDSTSHLSRIQELLDDPAIDGVSVCVANHAHAELAIAALRAGNDMVVTPDFEKQIPLVLAALEDGTLDEETIDAALRRVLGWKYDLGLLDAAP